MEDNKTLTTYLAAEPAPWSDVGGTYDLEFRHLVAHPDNLQRRVDSAATGLDWMKGNFDETKEVDFNANFGKPDKVQTIYHDDT